MADLAARGWVRFPFEAGLAAWARHADVAATHAERRPENARWMRCGGTWFVGVDALANDTKGRLPAGPPLVGVAIDAAMALAPAPLHRGQASVVYRGYPRQGAEESASAFRFRERRDAAHVDGLHRIMPGRRRLLKERHAWVLGIPLTECRMAPMTVWEGSHEIMRSALSAAFAGVPPADWPDHDVTDAYQAARRTCFETLRRVELPAGVGEAYLIHRLALHGVAPWRRAPDAPDTSDRRAIAYFRPELPGGDHSDNWLSAP